MTNRLLAVFFGMALLVFSACETTPPAPAPVNATNIFITGGLAASISVSDTQTSFSGGDLLQVRANLVNRTSQAIPVFYQFEWLDADGQQISAVTSNFKRQVLGAGRPTTLNGIATSPNAVDFRLIIQPVQ